MYYDKYLKYKNKYLQLKNQIGGDGEPFCEKAYKNILGTCWAVAIQMMLTFGQATSNDLKKVMKSFNFNKKNKFIINKITYLKGHPSFNDLFIRDMFNDSKSIFLRNILDKFIDRYHSKILEQKNLRRPVVIPDHYKNKGRCELVIAQNFKKLFEYPILTLYKDSYVADILSQFLFANLLSLFFLNHKVSFTNHYDKFNLINFDIINNLGIIIQIEDHYCCLYICDGRQKFYNDNNKIVYDCEWIDILKTTNSLYVEKDKNFSFINYDAHPNKQNLKKVLYLTVISKHTRDSDLDKQIKNILKNNYSSIKDRELQFLLGFKFKNGSGVRQDNAEAVRWWQLAAAQGDVRCQYFLGWMFDNGEGVAEDKAEAVRLYRLAADQGNAFAQNNLGWMFDNGEGVAEDKAEAVRLYRLAADQGYASAQNNLGVMFNNGEGVAQDNVEAMRWYRLAAAQGDADAQYNLGNMFEKGSGVAVNKAEAVRWWREAAAQGNVDAQIALTAIEKSP